MKPRTLVIVFCLIALFSLTGCMNRNNANFGGQNAGNYGQMGANRQDTDRYFRGVQGVEMTFMPNLPPCNYMRVIDLKL